jgi:membrane-associated phospholipid phosphatase
MPNFNENPNKVKSKPTGPQEKSGADKPAATNPPEQKLGDTPVAPWEMPTPDEKEQGKPVRRALKEAVKKVDSQEKADEVISNLESVTAGQTVTQIEKEQPKAAALTDAASKVEQAARTAPESQKTERVLEETARAVATPAARQREVVSEAAQEVLNPEQQGAPSTVTNQRARQFLRRAVLKRLKPLDALDADLFLLVNHLPHTRFLNSVFYGLTMAFKGGAAWFVLLGLLGYRRRETRSALFREAALPMAVAGTLVELPIKAYFRRRRPFISIIQAIVIGKKPGGWSFPSGHSAVAFAGAWLLNRQYPRWRPVTYATAGLVAFSRMYLGDHYPGDVASGSILGVLFAMGINWLVRRRKKT